MTDIISPELYQWLMSYGYFALFGLLALGIICLPVPDETLMILAGYLVSKGSWPLLPTVLAAIGGSICGITVSYLVGLTAGNFLFKKYGYLIGITEAKINYAQEWFTKIGKWALFCGYFIVGVRHFTGYIAGSALLRYRTFALYAYSGACLWGLTFISLGYFFSDQVEYVIKLIHFDHIFIIFIGILFFYIGWRWFKSRRYK